ncbi:hypothetical protein H6G33_09715 [Calothrix sp. FACHB-1219]|uniref:hypothetical protein n=1 Tax=unclassified Calothrix TaxID=2619626 RepID=UPI0016870CEE|nr:MULTISPECIES: hypothetical protein [unclassified Calothrix]MBD2201624.1 hypothetical protein [Calothrix sp. FACHB-168]MBD2217310.1 hypothetical protein [Calothrix sp. FACHB-1219]
MFKVIMIDKKKYNLLSEGANGKVIELDSNRVAKIFELGDSKRETSLMQQANQINELVCKFLKTEFTSNYSKELMIMERLYPLQYRAITVVERERMFEEFIKQIKELHSNGFAHWDIKRPSHAVSSSDRYWDNIILTRDGIRLIDTGNSVSTEDPDFEEACEDDIRSAMEFKKIFLIP